MADELSFLTINADTTSWVDFSPSSEVTGYQAQNTNIEARNLGQDDTSISISGTNITLDPSGVIDDDGLPIVINSAVTLPVASDGDWYIKVIAGSTSTQRSLTLQSGGGTWDTSKQGYYDTTDRVLNWKITRASGALKLYKRTKPNEGLELNGNLKATQADVTTVNATTGNITTVNATDVNATDVNATGVVTGGSFDSGNGATELYDMDQKMKTTDAVTFDSVNTGHGANDLYPMNQGVRTTDNVTHNNLTLTGEFLPTTNPTEDVWTTTTTIPQGIYDTRTTMTISSSILVEKFVNGAWEDYFSLSRDGGGSYNKDQGLMIISSGSDTRVSLSSGTSFAMRYLKY